MKLKTVNGEVPYLMECGKDMVADKMSLACAERICSRGTSNSNRFPGYPICVDDKFYFAGIEEKKPTKSKGKSE